ncbi:MAG TPA: universal stress protein [Kofleriaceae bacterium]|nr:universal stress protein [Kofleriaceae bacterium]
MHSILVATDFSEPARRAFDHATELAGLCGATMVIAHVYATPLVYAVAAPSVTVPPPDVGAIEVELEPPMHELADRARAAGVADVKLAIAGGDAAHEIVQVARDHGCDLIVMGTHGRSGVRHLVLGSIAEKVVRLAECPVLVVPMKTR